ncbi:hypothetical protein AAG906_001936 [Vitis piasezkii]
MRAQGEMLKQKSSNMEKVRGVYALVSDMDTPKTGSVTRSPKRQPVSSFSVTDTPPQLDRVRDPKHLDDNCDGKGAQRESSIYSTRASLQGIILGLLVPTLSSEEDDETVLEYLLHCFQQQAPLYQLELLCKVFDPWKLDSGKKCCLSLFHPVIRPLCDWLIHWNMAEAAAVVPSDELLEWPKKDKRRFLHVVYRVGDLDRTIKFYTECFGMKLLRKRDIPEEKYSNAFLGFGPEETNFVVELTYNYGVDKYDIGTGFGHFAIATQDVYKMVEDIRAKGGIITREPGPVKGGKSVIAFAKDPDGYIFELIQRGPTPEPLCQVMLRVGDLERSIKFYEKALGMKMVKKTDRPEYKYSIAMMGYAEEHETTVLELTYNYGVTEYTKGNAYAQVAISTDDVYKSAEVVNLVTKELGGKITRQPGPIPGLNTKITSFLDPDGWKTVLVDNEDFLKELHKEE